MLCVLCGRFEYIINLLKIKEFRQMEKTNQFDKVHKYIHNMYKYTQI